MGPSMKPLQPSFSSDSGASSTEALLVYCVEQPPFPCGYCGQCRHCYPSHQSLFQFPAAVSAVSRRALTAVTAQRSALSEAISISLAVGTPFGTLSAIRMMQPLLIRLADVRQPITASTTGTKTSS